MLQLTMTVTICPLLLHTAECTHKQKQHKQDINSQLLTTMLLTHK